MSRDPVESDAGTVPKAIRGRPVLTAGLPRPWRSLPGVCRVAGIPPAPAPAQPPVPGRSGGSAVPVLGQTAPGCQISDHEYSTVAGAIS